MDINRLFLLKNFDIDQILDRLLSVGAVSVRLLDERFRLALLQEAMNYPYRPEDEIVGSGDKMVRQQMGSFETFPEDSRFFLLKNAFQSLLEANLAGLETYPFETPLNFNSMVLQKYEPGSVGITPHRDHLSYINLVCVFNIGGRGRFFLCADRSGRDAREISAAPGTVILMRSPGLLGLKDRLFHYVSDIEETRYTFGLRQRRGPS